jgi:hypothetical protein
LLCLRVVTVNPAFITSDDRRQEVFIVGGELAMFIADVDALLLLFSCQDPGQIWRHDACSILSSEPVGITHNQFPSPQ